MCNLLWSTRSGPPFTSRPKRQQVPFQNTQWQLKPYWRMQRRVMLRRSMKKALSCKFPDCGVSKGKDFTISAYTFTLCLSSFACVVDPVCYRAQVDHENCVGLVGVVTASLKKMLVIQVTSATAFSHNIGWVCSPFTCGLSLSCP